MDLRTTSLKHRSPLAPLIKGGIEWRNLMIRLAICGFGLLLSCLGYVVMGYCLGSIPLWARGVVVGFAIAWAGILSGVSPFPIRFPLSWTWGVGIYLSWFALFGLLFFTLSVIRQESAAGLLLACGGLLGTIAWAIIVRQLLNFYTPLQVFFILSGTATLASVAGYILFLKSQIPGAN